MQITARSDFHGTNKPTIQLGMEVEDERVWVLLIGERLRIAI